MTRNWSYENAAANLFCPKVSKIKVNIAVLLFSGSRSFFRGLNQQTSRNVWEKLRSAVMQNFGMCAKTNYKKKNLANNFLTQNSLVFRKWVVDVSKYAHTLEETAG